MGPWGLLVSSSSQGGRRAARSPSVTCTRTPNVWVRAASTPVGQGTLGLCPSQEPAEARLSLGADPPPHPLKCWPAFPGASLGLSGERTGGHCGRYLPLSAPAISFHRAETSASNRWQWPLGPAAMPQAWVGTVDTRGDPVVWTVLMPKGCAAHALIPGSARAPAFVCGAHARSFPRPARGPAVCPCSGPWAAAAHSWPALDPVRCQGEKQGLLQQVRA